MMIGSLSQYASNVENVNNSSSIDGRTTMLKKIVKNTNAEQLQKVLGGNDKVPMIGKDNNAVQASKNQFAEKIRNMNHDLIASQEAETQIQNEMSYLDEKSTALETVKGAGDKLKELSSQYKSNNLSDTDKAEIEKQAEELIEGMGDLMNDTNWGKKSIMSDKVILLQSSDGKISGLNSEPFSIVLAEGNLDEKEQSKLNFNALESGKYFQSKVSTREMLQNSSIITDRILNPVQKALENVNKDKSTVYNKFLAEFSSATDDINKLSETGAISLYKKNKELNFQQTLLNSVSAMRFQSSNINKDNVSSLLR